MSAVRFLGPLVEKIIVGGIKEGYEKLPEVVRLFKQRHPEVFRPAGKGKPGDAFPRRESPVQLARRLSHGQSRMRTCAIIFDILFGKSCAQH